MDAVADRAGVLVVKRPVGDDVLGEDSFGFHGDDVRGDLHHRNLQFPNHQVHRANLQIQTTC